MLSSHKNILLARRPGVSLRFITDAKTSGVSIQVSRRAKILRLKATSWPNYKQMTHSLELYPASVLMLLPTGLFFLCIYLQ